MNAMVGSNDGDSTILNASEWISLSDDGVAIATGVFDDLASALTND
jgi:hypothetical protein